MKKLIYVNACMRDESRTLRIAKPIIEELAKKYEIETIDLGNSPYLAINKESLQLRQNKQVAEDIVELSKRIAAADKIVIAAPFWDMSFPSALKVFFENVSLFNISFGVEGNTLVGLGKCTDVIYITTRGMDISTGDPLEQATPYIKALSFLWGLGNVHVVAAQNMDFDTPEGIEARIGKAVKEGLEFVRKF